MWNASAMSAREWTANPTPNSSRKNMTSMTSITLMRVDLDHPMPGERPGPSHVFYKLGL